MMKHSRMHACIRTVPTKRHLPPCLPAAAILLAAALLMAGCAIPPRSDIASVPGSHAMSSGQDAQSGQNPPTYESNDPAVPPALGAITIPADVRVLICDCSVPGIASAPEFTRWERRYTDTSAPSEWPLPWGDAEVTGAYQYSVVRSGCDTAAHAYRTPDGTAFLVNAETGLPEACRPASPDGSGAQDLGLEACRELAAAFLSAYTDPSGFTVTGTWQNGVYRFDFTREIGGIPSEESATVTLLPDGSLHSYSSRMLGRIPEDTELPFAPQQADAWVLQRAKDICGVPHGECTRMKYGIRSRSVTLLGGEAVLHYYVDVACIRDFGDTEAIDSGLIELIVLPGHMETEE